MHDKGIEKYSVLGLDFVKFSRQANQVISAVRGNLKQKFYPKTS